jgi:hypothetical protein
MKKTGLFQHIIYAISIIILSGQAYAQLGIKLPPPPRVVTLFQPKMTFFQHYAVDSTVFDIKSKKDVFKVEMDSSAQYISARRSLDDKEFYLPAVVDINSYIDMRMHDDIMRTWRDMNIRKLSASKQKSSGAFELDIPFRIKNKTFTRIFGSDRIGLRVTGNISFDLSGRTEERSGSAVSALENQNTFSPRFKQTQQFTIEGKIGDKVTVSVDQNSEATTDIENTLKLRYKGDEDEILQSIEAGNISLSLPSTKYVMFGGSNKGLFGLKSAIKIGDLNVTAIASLEKGQQQELEISGSATESKSTIKDIDFIKNRYFFIDSLYRDQFPKGYSDDLQTFNYIQGKDIMQLDVYLSTNYGDLEARYCIAAVDPEKYAGQSPEDVTEIAGTVEKQYFKRLEPGKDYDYDPYRGFFWLNQSVNSSSVLAIAYLTSDRTKRGTLYEEWGDTLSTNNIVLKLIKPKSMKPSTEYNRTWPLMMRNVYSLGGTKIEKEGFDVRLENNKNGTHEVRQDVDPRRLFLNLTGLDVVNKNNEPQPDDIIDINQYTVDLANGILMFPSLQPFNPPKDAPRFNEIAEKNLVDMYYLNDTDASAYTNASKFEMIVTSKSSKSTFNLGFYVLENSEVVTLNGVTLKRDKDYIIDYFSGQLTLTSIEAKRSSANISIKYERANLFQLDKKTIAGTRAEYKLGDNSFVGLTALYLSKSTLDQRVRVGQEPFENFVWDLNGKFSLKPKFLTKAINLLPFYESTVESAVNIEGEFAQVLPNPNTLNNKETGDANGVAYIDDFESSRRTTTLGIQYRTWTMASPPAVLPNLIPGDASGDVSSYIPLMSDIDINNARTQNVSWFNPFHQVLIKDIWPNRDVNAQTGQTTPVLGVEFYRDADDNPDSTWGGFMRSTINFSNQQKTKYIELWIYGYDGTVNIDIGRISEDWYMKGRTHAGRPSHGGLNYEDENKNGVLDEGEDTGIDGIPFGEPGADLYDKWSAPIQNAIDAYDGYDYSKLKGTEGNSQSKNARYPDSEDLDGDGQLNVFNDYFEYTFSLDSNDVESKKWIAGATEKGWRQFRIPIKDYQRWVGNPDTTFQQIFFARMWFSDLPEKRTRIYIATFDFVGNEWEETGVVDGALDLPDTLDYTYVKNDSIFTLSTYNTEENVDEIPGGPEPYHSPPGVSGVRDRITKAMSKEQSLIMHFENFPARSIAEAKKALYSPMNLLNYERLRMFVHGDRLGVPESPDVDTSRIEFYIRFGSDNNNYYEFGEDVYAHWSKYNEIDIDLDELTQVKSLPDKFMRLPNKPSAYYKAVGIPILSTIRYFVIGVRNKDVFDWSGEIWLDELRLSNVRKVNATAMRLKTSIKLADLITLNAEWESKDADYHNISTQFGKGNTSESQNYSGRLAFGRLLPASWDLAIPIDGRVSFNRSIPKYLPKSDILSGYTNDNMENKVRSLFGMRDLPESLDTLITANEVYGFGVNVKKRTKSKKWYLRYTIDNLSADFDYSLKKSRNWEIEDQKSRQAKETFSFKVPFPKNNYIEPFKFVHNIPVLKIFSDQRFYYTPNALSMNLNISDAESRKTYRGDTTETRVINTNSMRSVSTSYKFTNSINFTYSRSHKADADFVGLTHKQLLEQIFTKGNFGLDTDIRQSFKGDFKPKFLKWLKPDFSYTSAFGYQLASGYKYKNSSNNTQARIGLSFNPSTLMKMIYTPKKSGGSKKSSGRGRPTRGAKKKTDKKKTKDTKKSLNTKSMLAYLNPLMLVYNVLASFQNIQMTYTKSNKTGNSYLKGIPTWQYQFGFTQDPGVRQDSSLGVQLKGPVLAATDAIKTSTGFTITRNIKISLTHMVSKQSSESDYGARRTGSKAGTYFVSGDNPQAEFGDLLKDWRSFVPDWNVRVSGIEKFLFFSQFAKSLSIDHAHSSKYNAQLALRENGDFTPNSETFTNSWAPLVGLNMQTIWGVRGSVRLTNNTNFSYSTGGGAAKAETKSFTVSLSYSKQTGFRIPIPIWPFKGKTFKNQLNLNLTFDSSSNKTSQKQFNDTDFVEKQSNSTWKLRPSATYRFSTRVQGSLFYEMGGTENKITGKYSYKEFGITVNISIRD